MLDQQSSLKWTGYAARRLLRLPYQVYCECPEPYPQRTQLSLTILAVCSCKRSISHSVSRRGKLIRCAGAVPVLTRAVAILSDLLVLVITWMKTADTWKNLGSASFKPKLSTLLIRDGESTYVLGEQTLTCLRYSILCVSILFEVCFSHSADEWVKYIVCVESCELVVECNWS